MNKTVELLENKIKQLNITIEGYELEIKCRANDLEFTQKLKWGYVEELEKIKKIVNQKEI